MEYTMDPNNTLHKDRKLARVIKTYDHEDYVLMWDALQAIKVDGNVWATFIRYVGGAKGYAAIADEVETAASGLAEVAKLRHVLVQRWQRWARVEDTYGEEVKIYEVREVAEYAEAVANVVNALDGIERAKPDIAAKYKLRTFKEQYTKRYRVIIRSGIVNRLVFDHQPPILEMYKGGN